jgi:hypothetical protein
MGFPAGPGAGGYVVRGLEDAHAGADPLSSPPPEYAGVPVGEIFAADDDADPGVAEAWDAGFLPRDVPAPPRAGTAGGFASGGPLDTAAPDPAVAAFADDVTGPEGGARGRPMTS